MKLITYSDGSEVLVTSLENEHNLIREYFTEGGRVLEDYDRTETDGIVEIRTGLVAFS